MENEKRVESYNSCDTSTNGTGVQAVGTSTDTMRNIVQYISNMVDVTG